MEKDTVVESYIYNLFIVSPFAFKIFGKLVTNPCCCRSNFLESDDFLKRERERENSNLISIFQE